MSEEIYRESDKPISLDWQNIENVWAQIKSVKDSKDPRQWESLINAVRKAIDDWRRSVDSLHSDVNKYFTFKRAFEITKDPEKKQKYNDMANAILNRLPGHIRKDVLAGKRVKPTSPVSIDSMYRALEGIRQADSDAYPAQVKEDIRIYSERLAERQHRLRLLRRALIERLDGVKDPKKLEAMNNRRNQIYNDYANLERELDIAINNNDEKRVESIKNRMKPLVAELKYLARRERGVENPEARAKLAEKIEEIDKQLLDDDQIRELVNKKAESMKYDALASFVTAIAMPIKVLYTNKLHRLRMDKPYIPQGWDKSKGAPQEKDSDIGDKAETTGISESRILTKLIFDGRYKEAKAFAENPFSLNYGDLVIIESGVAAGLKGRVRAIDVDSWSVVVDLFKNNKIANTWVEVALHKAKPYLQD
ncbi:MAG: hypothetical protein QXU32_00975 [Nitrososphaerales archaeon]